MAEDIYILKTNWNTRFFNQPERFMDLQQAMNDTHLLLVNDQGCEEHLHRALRVLKYLETRLWLKGDWWKF